MPYYFLSEEAALILQDDISRQIKCLERQIWMKKATWNDLGNKVCKEDLPERIKTDYLVIDKTKKEIETEKHETKHTQEEAAEDTKIEKPMLSLTEKPEQKGLDEVLTKSWDELNPMMQAPGSSIPGGGIKPVAPNLLRNTDVFIPRFEYDSDGKKFFENVFFNELPDGRAVLDYGGVHYYTTQKNIMVLPYPFPEKYFEKIRGWNTTNTQAVRKYRKYLAENPPKKEESDDWKYRPILNTNTRTNREEEKVEGVLE